MPVHLPFYTGCTAAIRPADQEGIEATGQLDELSDQLIALEEEVSELNKVVILLMSVQESYPTLATTLLARGDEELTLMFVKRALLATKRNGR